jgi:hypothetical protein
VDLKDPDGVLRIYKRIIVQDTFQTQVGLAYLRELQEYLHSMPQIPNEQIPAIPVRREVQVLDAAGTAEHLRKENQKSRKAFHWSLGINFLAAAMIVGMFVIAMSSSSPTVLNYENELINKYSTWEQELNEREQAVKEKERNMLDVVGYGD